MREDPEFELLGQSSLHTVCLVARIYTAQSLQYKQQAEYWLDYLHLIAMKITENDDF